jgi:hypothetical protein
MHFDFSDKTTSVKSVKRVKFNVSVGVSSVVIDEEVKDEQFKKVIYMQTTGKDYRAHFSRRDEEVDQVLLTIVPL